MIFLEQFNPRILFTEIEYSKKLLSINIMVFFAYCPDNLYIPFYRLNVLLTKSYDKNAVLLRCNITPHYYRDNTAGLPHYHRNIVKPDANVKRMYTEGIGLN